MGRKTNAVCKICNKDIYVRPSHLSINGNYCSRSCYGKGKERELGLCLLCGEKFKRKKREQKFCSIKCATSRSREDKWNGNGKNKSDLIKKKFIEMGWDGKCMCSGCNYSNIITVHRIFHGKDGGNYDIHNCCLICPNHHYEIHLLGYNIERVTDFTFNISN